VSPPPYRQQRHSHLSYQSQQPAAPSLSTGNPPHQLKTTYDAIVIGAGLAHTYNSWKS